MLKSQVAFLKAVFEFNSHVITRTLELLGAAAQACPKSEAWVSQSQHNISCIETPYLQRWRFLILRPLKNTLESFLSKWMNTLDSFLSKICSWNLSFLHIFHPKSPENHLFLPIKCMFSSLLKLSRKFDNVSVIPRKSVEIQTPFIMNTAFLCFWSILLCF